ncbi:hypothetical protein B0H14DRAFT_2566134 [Mycena olivaceomarginata]|nr:hypothetical protein B0H14DRAFT_2566134 [Mycena olivaceomarginata]
MPSKPVMICLMSRVGATNPPLALASPLRLGRPWAAIYTEPSRSNVRTKSDFPTSARVVLYPTGSKTTPKPNPKTSTQGRRPFVVVGHVPASRSSGSLFGPHVSPTAETLNRSIRVRAGPAQTVLRDADGDRNTNIHSCTSLSHQLRYPNRHRRDFRPPTACSLPAPLISRSPISASPMSSSACAASREPPERTRSCCLKSRPVFPPGRGAPTTTRPPTEALPTPFPSPALLRHHPQQEMKEKQEKEDTEESPIKEPCRALALRSVRLPEPFVFTFDSSSSDESGSPAPTPRRQRRSPLAPVLVPNRAVTNSNPRPTSLLATTDFLEARRRFLGNPELDGSARPFRNPWVVLELGGLRVQR